MPLKIFSISVITILLLNLSGCAIMARPYQDATGHETAKFTVTHPFNSGVMFVHTFEEAHECRSRYLIGLLTAENNTKTVTIPTDKVFVYRVAAHSCALTIGFNPKSGKHYYASLGYDSEKEICSNILYEITDGNYAPVTDAYLKSNFGGTRMDENSSWCSEDKVEQYVQ